MKQYNVDYFIEKFTAIPLSMWNVGGYGNVGGPRCAMGWCCDREEGEHAAPHVKNSIAWNEEVTALINLFRKLPKIENNEYRWVSPSWVNDRLDDEVRVRYPQTEAKERILAALGDIKEIEEQEALLSQVETLINSPVKEEVCV